VGKVIHAIIDNYAAGPRLERARQGSDILEVPWGTGAFALATTIQRFALKLAEPLFKLAFL
jgi:hypothetical protein